MPAFLLFSSLVKHFSPAVRPTDRRRPGTGKQPRQEVKQTVWETLYDDFWDKLVRFCCRMTRDEGRAEDLAQETFLRALGNQSLLNTLSTAQQKSWLFETAHNLFCDSVRRSAKEQELLERFTPPPGEEPADDTAASAMGQVELNSVLSHLADNDRALFTLRYDAGYTAAELARLTGQPAATIRTRLHRIRAVLKEDLKEE